MVEKESNGLLKEMRSDIKTLLERQAVTGTKVEHVESEVKEINAKMAQHDNLLHTMVSEEDCAEHRATHNSKQNRKQRSRVGVWSMVAAFIAAVAAIATATFIRLGPLP